MLRLTRNTLCIYEHLRLNHQYTQCVYQLQFICGAFVTAPTAAFVYVSGVAPSRSGVAWTVSLPTLPPYADVSRSATLTALYASAVSLGHGADALEHQHL